MYIPRTPSGRVKKLPDKLIYVLKKLKEVGFPNEGISDYYNLFERTVWKYTNGISRDNFYNGYYLIKAKDVLTGEVIKIFKNVKEIAKMTNKKQNYISTSVKNKTIVRYEENGLRKRMKFELIYQEIDDYAKMFEEEWERENQNNYRW